MSTRLASRPRRAVMATAVLGAVLMAMLPGAVRASPSASPVAPANNPGYWEVAADGGVYQFRTSNYGGMRGQPLNRPVVGGAATLDGLGYWMVASDGGIFAFGDARFFGSAGNIRLYRPIVGMAVDPATGGYWMVASDGGIFSYNAPFFGSTGNIALAKPIVGMAPTPDGGGYWLVASDGGVFAFGDAGFYGSAGNIALAKPVVGMAATADGRGYWLVASDGGIFTYGDGAFYGSAGNIALVKPVVGMAATTDGHGYWLMASDGGVFTYGNAPFLGSAAADGSPAPLTGFLSTANAYPFPPGSTGYDISQYQCPGANAPPQGIPSQRTPVAIVQVSGGAINNPPNPCYAAEAAWAGPNLADYIFLDELPVTPPSESLQGPAGTCNGNVDCQSYNFGWYWARYWVNYSRNQGYKPSLWFLDVEVRADFWADRPQDSNAAVVSGAVAGLQSMSVIPGLYSTHYQWTDITGGTPNFPGIALWEAGADLTVAGNDEAICTGTYNADHGPFAGGKIIAVQYLNNGGYQGDDRDYACK